RTLRLRNWRRRHRPMRTAPRLGEAGDNPPNAENGAAEAIANAATAAAPGDIGAPRPRRRRRRPHYPIPERPPGDSGESAAGDTGSVQAPGEVPTRPLGTRPPRSRNRRRRRPPIAAFGTAAAAENSGAAPTERPAGRPDRDRPADGPPGRDQRQTDQ